MAIAVLVSSTTEAERFTAFGLDLAARLKSPVVFLCVQPNPDSEKNTKGEKPKGETTKSEKTNDSTISAKVPAFSVAKSYVELTRNHVIKHIGTMAYGFVLNDAMEVPNEVEKIRKWICSSHESPQLGHFSIDTLFIPMLRGAGLEHAREEKDLLFESSRIETIYLSLEQVHGRLPLNNIGVAGENHDDVLNASRFARRFANVQVRKVNDDQRDPDQLCVVVATHGKSNQTRIDNSPGWKTYRNDSSLPVVMLLNPADTRRERIHSALDDKIQHWFQAYQLSREDRIRLSKKLEAGAASSPEFILFMAVATFLACIGLIQDSAAVIIGAMLVAPLMTPLLGAGLAMIFANRPLFGKAIRSILLGVTIAFLIGTVVGLFSLYVPAYLLSGNGLSLTNEMISRSQPNLLDPFIGLAAGLAGGFAIGRDGQIGTVAGVAIAAALVPPIATAGLEAALAIQCSILDGDPLTFFRLLQRDPGEILANHNLLNIDHKPTLRVHLISAPLILFALNGCATIIGAFLGLRLVGMHRSSRPRQSRKWVFVFLIVLFIAIVILMIVPLMW